VIQGTSKPTALAASNLYLETTRLTTSTSLLELASLGSGIRLDSVMCMFIGNSGTVSKVSKCLAALGSTEKNSVGSGRSTECELIKGEAFSSSSKDALTCILGEGKSTDGHCGYFHHTDIVGNLSYNDCNMSILALELLSKTIKSYRGLVEFGHVKTLDNDSTEFGVSTTSKEFVQLDEKTVVGVGGLDDLGGDTMSGTATSCFQINSHFVEWLKSER